MASIAALPDIDALGAIATELAARAVAWEERTGAVPAVRSYERIVSTSTYEAWLICWPVGTRLDLHDHGQSAGAFAVVCGTLDETVVVEGTAVVHHHRHGSTQAFGPSYVHAVANHGEHPATSVHVYSPPLGFMDFYDQDDDGALQATRRDSGEWNAIG
jgi:oxalate decarboxylase/phosphoglucose isomerase-like protein (cupin superfamily)